MINNKVIYVEDHIDAKGSDDAAGIRAAIHKAIEVNAEIVVFEPREYILRTSQTIQTEGFAHDAGSSDETWKECHIPIRGAKRLTLQGSVDENGEPATVLVGFNDLQVNPYLPAILWCEDCDHLQVRNLAFTREPEFASAGIVVSNDGNQISVEVFQGNPCYDNMGTYCMNRLHPDTGALIGESVTYGAGAGCLWRLQGERRLLLNSSDVASKVQVGECLSWHQGAQTDFQMYFSRCDDLALNNIRTFNSNGFCILTENCHGIAADRVIFRPKGKQLFTGPRDAWKIYKCSGNIEIRRMIVEGVRMDGQNLHHNWLVLKQITKPNEAVFFCKYSYAPLAAGSRIQLYREDESESYRIVESSRVRKADGGNEYRVVFDRDLAQDLREGTLGTASCWKASRYICKDSEFVNIAGAGHLVRYDHLYIINCKYRNTMNPGILLGAELPVHSEGGHASDILIKDCEFDNCGFFPRYGARGCIGIKSHGFKGKFNKNIIIANNTMKNSDIGIHAVDADQVYLIENRFEKIDVPLLQDDPTVGRIWNHG